MFATYNPGIFLFQMSRFIDFDIMKQIYSFLLQFPFPSK
ncbi:hypothetical protein CLV62_10888 [Dysgonomonas alginatilytica]|uniref:Uncharacterized protein n=1 Tax=Dysgonomonas alginatilytica TaxID=1605892 RepID=A0A2V3PS74_9BACT|nr:hypothetical protein CLV62_10888 [Dysgonomonas alginatilytica]